jgi:anti-sigma regulatory factor (Ser/Thr protein kinase)
VGTTFDVSAAGQRPPLTKRLSARHWTAVDYVVGALVGVILFASIRHSVVRSLGGPYGELPYRPLSLAWPLAVFLVFTAVIAVAMRRRRPSFMLGVLLAGSLVVTMLTGPQAGGALAYFLPVAYVLYLVAATYERRRAAVRVLAAVFATLVADAVLMHLTGGGVFLHGGLVSVALCVIIAWFTGYIVRQRRRYAVRLQDEAASKAGYGQYVIDTQPAGARDALGAIQATSREALDEMRRMLGALRQADQQDVAAQAGGGSQAGTPGRRAGDCEADGCTPLFPAPGLADLDRLLSRTASAGVRVDVTRGGQLRDLPASIDLSVYRIVQEALTNVVKHARTSSCRVLIGYGREELILEVTDNGAGLAELAGAGISQHRTGAPGGSSGGGTALDVRPVPGWSTADGIGGVALGGGGHGIIGMRERVMLLGGEFSAGPRPGYGFQVIARIPLPAGRP